MTRANGFSVQYFHGLTGLETLRPLWERMFLNCCNDSYYNDWRWHHALQKYLIPSDVCYVYVHRDDAPVAILPLQLVVRGRTPFKVRTLTFPYHVAVDLSDMLVAEGFSDVPFLDALFDNLRSEPPFPWDVLQLAQFTERSCFRRQADVLAAMYSPMGKSAYVTSESANLSERLSKKQIKNVRRHQRNAEDTLGTCTFETATNPAELPARYDAFLKVESSGWKGDDGTKSAIVLRPDAKVFYGEVLRMFGETGHAVVSILSFGGKPAAAQIGLRTNKRLSLLKIGFDEAFREYGPGAVALLKCIDSETQQVRELSLVTCPPWSERWHFVQEQKYVLEVFNDTLHARLFHMARWLLKKVKVLLSAAPPKEAAETQE